MLGALLATFSAGERRIYLTNQDMSASRRETLQDNQALWAISFTALTSAAPVGRRSRPPNP